MAGDGAIWIRRNGVNEGPYAEPLLREWLLTGKVEGAVLAWRKGMAEWARVAVVLGIDGPLPSPQPVVHEATRQALPDAPAIPWWVVALLGVLTFGAFFAIWALVQAWWVRRIDRKGRALLWAGIAACCWVGRLALNWWPGWVAAIVPSPLPLERTVADSDAFLMLACFGFGLGAVYSIAGSLRRKLPEFGLNPDIDNTYVFFFGVVYLQGRLNWAMRWKRTGSLEPRPPDGMLWIALLFSLGYFMLFSFVSAFITLGN